MFRINWQAPINIPPEAGYEPACYAMMKCLLDTEP